jgi:hypothetical protein
MHYTSAARLCKAPTNHADGDIDRATGDKSGPMKFLKRRFAAAPEGRPPTKSRL